MNRRSLPVVLALVAMMGASIAQGGYHMEWQSPDQANYTNISDVRGPAPYEGYDLDGDGRSEIVYYERIGEWGDPWTYIFRAIDSQSHDEVWSWTYNAEPYEYCTFYGFLDFDEDDVNEAIFQTSTEAYDHILAIDPLSGTIEWNKVHYDIWVLEIYDVDNDGYPEITLVADYENHWYIEVWGGDASGTPCYTSPPASLSQNHPNPFNPETRIDYLLPEPGTVSLRVVSSSGRVLRNLFSGYREAGEYSVSWDGTDNQSRRMPSGVYHYELRLADKRISRKMILLK